MTQELGIIISNLVNVNIQIPPPLNNSVYLGSVNPWTRKASSNDIFRL